jgi:hypothetical protein
MKHTSKLYKSSLKKGLANQYSKNGLTFYINHLDCRSPRMNVI